MRGGGGLFFLFWVLFGEIPPIFFEIWNGNSQIEEKHYNGVARPKKKSGLCSSYVVLMYYKKRGVKKFFHPLC